MIPLRRNNKIIDYTPVNQRNKRGFEGYFFYKKRPIWYSTTIKVIEEKESRMFLFYR